MAALMACTEMISDNILFESVDISKYSSWTKKYVREVSDKLAEEHDASEKAQSLAKETQSNLPIDSEPSDANTSKLQSSSDQTSYVSIVNESYQKLGKALPNYEVLTEYSGLTTKFRCVVRNFDGLPDIRTELAPSKRVAKNEAAKQIYEYLTLSLKDRSITTGKIRNILSQEESNSDVINVIKKVFSAPSDQNISPGALIPLVMNILMHVSKICYPDKPAIDGIYEMIDQWEKFLNFTEKSAQI